MPSEPHNFSLILVVMLVIASAALLAAGYWLHNRGGLRSNATAGAWSALVLAPAVVGILLYAQGLAVH
jgi:hypothetical protein